MSSAPSGADSSAKQTQLIELPELTTACSAGATLLSVNSALLDSVNVSLTVVVGQVHMTFGELMRLKDASVLKVDRTVDLPVDVMVNGNVIARGQLVVVDDSFGVRLTDVALTAKA